MKVTKRKLSPAAATGVGIGFAVLLAAMGWFLLVSPQRSRAAEYDAQIAAVSRQIEEARAAQVQARTAEPIRTADLFRLTKAMPGNNDIAGVLLELSRVAAETGIVFEQIVPMPTLNAGTFRAQPIELVFVGNFYSLSDFLYRMRNLVSVQRGRLLATGRLFSVDKVQFVEADDLFPNIKALLTVSAFLYGTSPVSGAPPAPVAPVGTDTSQTDATQTDTAQTDTTQTEPATAPEAPSATGAP